MIPKESECNQSKMSCALKARAHCDVFQARLPWQGIVKWSRDISTGKCSSLDFPIFCISINGLKNHFILLTNYSFVIMSRNM